MQSRRRIAVATVTSIESRVADRGGSRVLASSRHAVKVFSCSRVGERSVLRGSRWERVNSAWREQMAERKGVWEEIEEDEGRAAGVGELL